MPKGDKHPSAKQLSDYNLGSLPPPAADTVAAHLQSCTHCQEQLPAAPRDSSHSGRKGGTVPPTGGAAPRQPARAKATELPTELQALGKFEVLGKLGEGGMGAV